MEIMKPFGREVKIGIVALLILLCAYFGINFLKGKDLLGSKNTYYALYDDVSGLKTSSAVVIRGVKVGIVSDIEFADRDGGKIKVSLNIARKYKIPQNSVARLFSDGLMGGMAIEIITGDDTEVLKNRDYMQARSDAGLLSSMGDGAEDLLAEINAAVRSLSSAVRNIDTLIAKNSGSLTGTIDNLHSVTARLDGIVAAQDGNIRSIIEGAGSLAENIKNNSEPIDAIVANVEGITDSLRGSELKAVVDNLSETIAEVNSTLRKINTGDGTAARLVNDEALYRSLVESADNLAALLEDLKAHPSRYVNVTIFGRRDKNKEK